MKAHAKGRDEIPRAHLFTSHEAAMLLQVNPSSLNNWIRAGKLDAFRTPGGHRRVAAGELAKFVVEVGMPVPEPLKSLTVPNILWVDSDAARLKKISALGDSSVFPMKLRVASSLVGGLVEIGRHTPDALILDATAADVPRASAVLAVRERSEAVIVAFVDGQLTQEDEEAASRIDVSLCIPRSARLRQMLERVLAEVVSSSSFGFV